MASYRSEIIYTPPMEANWAKVPGKARAVNEGDELKWSIDLLGDPNDEEITELRNKIRGFMVECRPRRQAQRLQERHAAQAS